MIREFFVRGERQTVEEIDSVIAVKVTADERGDALADPQTFGSEARADDTGMSPDTAEAFRRALWFFVEPSQDVERSLDATGIGMGAVPNADSLGKLVKRSNGRFGIVTKRLNVQLRADIPETDAEQALTESGLQLLTRLRFAPNLFEVDAVGFADALAASVELTQDPRFTLAEPSLIEHVPSRVTPTDPRYPEQWQWANGARPGADVHAESAWDRTRGAGMKVAVIDNGFNVAHEDLVGAILPTSAHFGQPGTGAPNLIPGPAGMPAGDHGTFCAGLVGARANNARGGCGAAPESGLMLIACLNDQVGTQTTLARAIAYAANPATEIPGADPTSGADIIVSSLGPNGAAWNLTQTLELALEFAASQARSGRGAAIFWAASNGANVDVLEDEVVSHADVIAVVRSTSNDLEDNAARGPEVELIAPGVQVVSTTGNGGYGASTGTSFAAPVAAGSAALALSVNPELTRDELRQIMHDSADKIGGVVYDANGHNDDYGFGRVNAQQAVALAEGTLAPPAQANAIALVRQAPGWGSIPVAFANGDGNWTITNGATGSDFIQSWANTPGVRVVSGDFNGNGLTDVALVRQTPGWASIPIAFASGDGNWTITNGATGPDFIQSWANTPGVKLVPGDYNGNGMTDIALVRQTPGWASIPIAFANGDGNWTITNGATGPDFIQSWANTPGVKLIPGDFNGNGLTDIALVRQTPGWGSIPIAFANGDGTWTITNGATGPDFIGSWANTPGVRLVPGDFNGNGLTDIALVRQTPGWGSIPIAFANGDGTWTITNGATGPDFIGSWANTPGVKLVPGDYNGNGLTDIALVRQTPGWGSIPIAFANGDGNWTITNGATGSDFIQSWAPTPGVKLVSGDFNSDGITDIALVRQTPGWGSIPIAFATGDGNWTITNGATGPDFIQSWAPTPGVKLVPGSYK